MPVDAAQELQSITLRDKSKTAVILGATTGIGAAVARAFAKLGCSRVVISGRDELRARDVLDAMRGSVPEDVDSQIGFVKRDLMDIKGMRATAEAIEKVVGKAGIDYLVMCQNGMPTGTIVENEDGVSIGFAVQAVSRFALAYMLTTHDALAPNAVVMSIANPGLNLDGLMVDDLSLKRRAEAGRYKMLLFLDQSKRDSTVLDSVTEEFNLRYPQYQYFHAHPGLVRSELFMIDAFPFPINWGVSLGLQTIGTTPQAYANIPVYVAVSREAQARLGTSKCFDHRLNPLSLGNWASNAENRHALWTKLTEMIGA